MNRFAISLGAGLAVLAASAPVHAYETLRTQTTNEELHFRVMPQDFYFSDEGADDVAGTGEFEALLRAFESWAVVTECDARFSDFSAVSMDAGDIYKDGGDPARDRTNLVAWRETNWPEGPEHIALTYSYYVETTGKLLEADIAMNGQDYDWTVGDTAVLTDVESIAAHEVGHAFGLGHSGDAEATMYATTSQGETKKRSLSDDDIAGIQHLYPPGCCKSNKAQEALAFFGCSASGATGRGTGAAAASLVAGAVLTFVLHRRRSRGFGGPEAPRMEDAASPKGEQVRKAGAALAAALLTLPLAASTADATVSRALPLEELVGASETVVRGRVIFSQAITNPGGSIVTLSEIEVEDVLAGDAPATITVVEPGGEPGDTGVGMTVSGAARFEAGEEVVVFARPTKGAYEEKFPGTFRPVGMSQGKLRVVRESGTARVLRDLSGIARVTASPDGGWAPVRGDELSGLTLDELVQRVTSATAASPR